MQELDMDKGKVSEWNEGNLKSLRLHEAQELINTSKMNYLKSLGDGRYSYDSIISAINILYGEGSAKYSEEERNEVDKIKELVELRREALPPHTIINNFNMGNRINKSILNLDNWKSLKVLIELYENKVKCYNDIHGLSTRNYDDMDDGL